MGHTWDLSKSTAMHKTYQAESVVFSLPLKKARKLLHSPALQQTWH